VQTKYTLDFLTAVNIMAGIWARVVWFGSRLIYLWRQILLIHLVKKCWNIDALAYLVNCILYQF